MSPRTESRELHSTKELPVLALPDEPTEDLLVGAPPAGLRADRATQTENLDEATRPVRRAVPGASQVPTMRAQSSASRPPAPVPSAPPAPQGPRGRRPNLRGLIPATLVAAVLGAGVGGYAAGYRLQIDSIHIGGAAPSASASASGGTVAQVQVSSFDPVGGSGLRRTDAAGSVTWRTQTYASAQFGNLKPGVALVLDLGSAKQISAVTFTAGPGPLTVQLRSADGAPTSADSGQSVGGPVSASGRTTLDAGSAGAHRYWMIWITELAPADGGYGATVTDPVVVG